MSVCRSVSAASARMSSIPSTPSSSVNEDGLTQEQMEAIKAENEAAGWKPDLFGDSNLGNNTGETCDDFLEHN